MKRIHSSSGAFNQTPPLADYNLYCTDLVLREAVLSAADITPAHGRGPVAP